MKNTLKSLGIIALAAVIIFSMAGCSDGSDNGNGKGGTPTFTVTFNANGGTPEPQKQTVAKGGKVTQPPAMTKADYGFGGWFTDNDTFANEWDFAVNTVTANITLYAKWDTSFYTVTFSAEGGDPDSIQQKVPHGGQATEPDPLPTKAGEAIEGWYTEDDFTTKWDFATGTVTADITLYAKWVPAYTVNFNSDGGSMVSLRAVPENSPVPKPADPTKTFTRAAGLYVGGTVPAEYTFVEWREEGETDAFDFDTPITADITLTAVWTSNYLSETELPPVASNSNIVTRSLSHINNYIDNLDGAERDFLLILDANVDNVAAITHDKDGVTLTITSIDDTERTISKGTAANGRVFTVGGTNTTASSAKLVIDDTVTLKGKDSNGSNPVVYVGYGGSLELKGNAKITGNSAASAGVQARGSTGNRVTITMSGNAEISNNICRLTSDTGNDGGGVNLYYASLTMSDNASIKNNNIDNAANIASYGGGVYMSTGSSFTMEGGTISGNTVKAYGTGVAQGGGVCISSFASAYPFTMNGGEISGNAVISENANAQGGGVFIAGVADCKFIVASEAVKANIKENTVTRTGTSGSTTGPQVYRGNSNGFTVGGVLANTF